MPGPPVTTIMAMSSRSRRSSKARTGRSSSAMGHRREPRRPTRRPLRTLTRIRVNASPQAASVASALSGTLPPPVVAGFMGNFHVEGGFDGAKGDGGSASGIAQWHNDRAANFEKVIGKPVTEATPAEQAQFVNWEMQHPEAAGMTVAQRDAIMNAKTAPQAAALIDQYYERSSGKDRQDRMTAASAFAGGSNGSASAAPAGYHVLVPAKPQDAPSGYRYKGDGSLEAIPGGPADPNGVKNAGPVEAPGARSGDDRLCQDRQDARWHGRSDGSQPDPQLSADRDGRYGLTPDDIPSIQQQFGADAKAFKPARRSAVLHAPVGRQAEPARAGFVEAHQGDPAPGQFHAVQLDHPRERRERSAIRPSPSFAAACRCSRARSRGS
jgi:hypothetical protein